MLDAINLSVFKINQVLKPSNESVWCDLRYFWPLFVRRMLENRTQKISIDGNLIDFLQTPFASFFPLISRTPPTVWNGYFILVPTCRSTFWYFSLTNSLCVSFPHSHDRTAYPQRLLLDFELRNSINPSIKCIIRIFCASYIQLNASESLSRRRVAQTHSNLAQICCSPFFPLHIVYSID